MTRVLFIPFAVCFATCLACASPVAAGEPAGLFADAPVVIERALLDKIEFKTPNVLPTADPKQDTGRLATAVRLSKTRYGLGEPVWAYFIVKNVGEKRADLGFRLFPSRVVTSSDGYSIALTTADGTPVARSGLKRIRELRSSPISPIEPGAYYVARWDLRRLVQQGHFRAGAYDVSWTCRSVPSNKVRFEVGTGVARAELLEHLPQLHFAQLISSGVTRRERRSMRTDAFLGGDQWHEFGEEIFTGLALGVDGRYYPDPHHLPQEDGQLAMRLELRDKFGDPCPREKMPRSMAVFFTTTQAEGVEMTLPKFYVVVESRTRDLQQNLSQMFMEQLKRRLVTVTPDKPAVFHLSFPKNAHFGVEAGQECRFYVLASSVELTAFSGSRVIRRNDSEAWRGVLVSNKIELNAFEQWADEELQKMLEMRLEKFEDVVIDD